MPALLVACRAHVSPYRSARASLKGGAMKRVLVTGANKGIGLAVVERLLSERTDTVVLLGCRSSERGRAAAATLLAREPSWAARLETLQVNVNDAAQVQSAAADVRARHGDACLYGLVNNAGIADGTHAEIVDTNLRGVKVVTDAFASLVAPSGRVVNVSSGSAPMFVAECAPERVRFFRDASTTWAALDTAAKEYVAACAAGEDALAALGYPRKPNPYGFSKASLNVLTMQQAAALLPVLVNACSPGFIVTDLTEHMMKAYGKSPAEAGALPPSQGTIAINYLLFDDTVPGGGRYYGSDGKRSPLHLYRSPGSPAYEGDGLD